MPDLQLKDVCGFKVWALVLVNNDDNFAVPDANTFIDFHGEGDGTYLVINVKTSKTSSIEYVFLAADEANEGKSIILIFDFLKTVNYSLHELLLWLANAEYKPTEIGNRIYIGDITISCDHVGTESI